MKKFIPIFGIPCCIMSCVGHDALTTREHPVYSTIRSGVMFKCSILYRCCMISHRALFSVRVATLAQSQPNHDPLRAFLVSRQLLFAAPIIHPHIFPSQFVIRFIKILTPPVARCLPRTIFIHRWIMTFNTPVASLTSSRFRMTEISMK